METLNITKNTLGNIYQTFFNSKNKLSAKEKVSRFKGDLIALYLIAIRLYYVVYN